ncbi:MAG: T9SS type A sorting domain-containing protein [Ferruginibacter sp.]
MKTFQQSIRTYYFFSTGRKPVDDCLYKFPFFRYKILGCLFLVLFYGNVFSAGKPFENNNNLISVSDSMSIDGPSFASGGTTSGGTSVCSSGNTGIITLSGQTGSVVRWELSTNGGTIWTPISNTSTTQSYNNLVQSTKYRAVVQNGLSTINSTISTITVKLAPSATINYAGSPYCANLVAASVTRTGTTGGTYSSTAGLSIAPSTGKITMLTSTPGTYTVTYSIAASGGCGLYTTTASVTILATPSATIAYMGSPYCKDEAVATVTMTGTTGGVFSSTSGLIINSSTGSIDLTASNPGSYTVTYTVTPDNGCAVYRKTASVVISAPLTASISYPASPYCSNAGYATVSRTGTGFGTYSSTPGLDISASTGRITLATSVAGTYEVSYTVTNSGCTTTATAPVVINEMPSAIIGYAGNALCSDGGIASVTRTGTAGGVFSGPAGLQINSATGDITLATSPVGTYVVTYSIAAAGNCPAFSTAVTITISNRPPAPSGTDQEVCSNGDNTQTLTATATGGNISWYDQSLGGNMVASPVQTGPGTVTYYAQNTTGGCASNTRTPVTLTINQAPEAPLSDGDKTVCSDGTTDQLLTATASSLYEILWYDAATDGNNIVPEQTGIGTSTWYAAAFNGTCYSPSRTPVTLTINPVFETPGPISGPLNVCPLIGSPDPSMYSVDAMPGSTFYTWQVPPGATLVSGQGTPNIQVTFDNSLSFTHNMMSVTAESTNACTSAASELEILKTLPGMPVSINGPANICEFIGNSTNAVYSIDPVENANSYTWIVSGAAEIVSGQGTTNVEVQFFGTFVMGSIKVTANSNCGSRAARSLSISTYVPSTPSSITGATNACPYVGTGTIMNYSIRPATNAISYLWTVPAHVTLLSGQGTTAITVTFDSGYTTSAIKVRSIGSCITSADRSLTVITPTGSRPGQMKGPSNACAYINTGNEATYSISKVANGLSYIWSVPTGAIITSHPGGTGLNDTSITVLFDEQLVAGTMISVQAVNCIPGAARTLTLLRTLPARPGIIAGPSNVCAFMSSASNPEGTPVVYTIRKSVDVKSYSWTVPQNATITGHPAGTGINDTIVEITYDSTFVQGTISVAAVNGCGTGVVRTLSVSRSTLGSLSNISSELRASCPNRVYSYTVAAMPGNATGINWTVPAGAEIVSGQGTTSITVSFSSSAITGTVTARAYNNCMTGSSRTSSVNLAACTGGGAKMAVAVSGLKAPVASSVFETKIFPNPAINDFKIAIATVSLEPITIRIMDIQGNELRRFTSHSKEVLVNAQDLKAGTYLAEITQGANKTIQKIIKL